MKYYYEYKYKNGCKGGGAKMKPLNLKETALKEEMKDRCLAKGEYIDENARAKFKVLCHLEDFEVQYWKLHEENKILRENAENNDKVVDKVNWENMLLKKEIHQLKEKLLVSQTNEETFRLEMEDITRALGLDEDTLFDDVKAYSRSLKDNWNKLEEWVDKCYDYYTNEKDYIGGRLCFTDMKDKMQELEQGSDEQMYDKCSDCEYTNYDNYVQEVENQQKEFIEWLEEELKRINPSELTVIELVDSELDQVEFTQYLTYKYILQKYKEIIGGNKDE